MGFMASTAAQSPVAPRILGALGPAPISSTLTARKAPGLHYNAPLCQPAEIPGLRSTR